MNKWLPVFLAILIVASACGPGGPIPETFDWCYRYDFTSNDYGFTINEGTWIDGSGFTTDGGGNLHITHFHNTTVEPEYIVISGARAVGASGDINISGTATVFGVTESLATTIPAFINEAQVPMVPENAGLIGNNISIDINTSAAIHLQALEIRGNNFNPFEESNCSPDQPTPTADPITATPTDDPLLDTLTPSETPTPSETFTPSPTFTVTPTPVVCAFTDTVRYFSDDSGRSPEPDSFTPWHDGTTGPLGIFSGGAAGREVVQDLEQFYLIDRIIYRSYVQSTFNLRPYVDTIVNGEVVSTYFINGSTGIFSYPVNFSEPVYANEITLFAYPQPGKPSMTFFLGYIEIRYCTDAPTPTASPTNITPTHTSTGIASSTPRPSRTPNIIATATPSQQCLMTNFDSRNELTLTYPPGGANGIVSFPSGGNPPGGNALRFSTELDGDHVNERAFVIQTQPTWLIQTLSYSYRVINNGTDEGSARYMWWDTGTGPERINQPLSVGGSINWSTQTIAGINVTGYSGIGVEYNIIRSALSHVEIDNVELCFTIQQTPSPSPTGTLDIPTLDVTPTFITASVTPPPTTTLIPFPTALPTYDLTSTPEGGPEAEQVDLLTGIADSIGGFFNFIINSFLNFFNWLGSFIGWFGGLLNNFLIMLGNLLSAIVGFFNLIFHFIGAVLEIIALILAIIWHLLTLVGAWIQQFIDTIRTIWNTWYLADPQPIPFMPQCASNPLSSPICAFYYIVSNTVLAEGIGGLLLPVTYVVVGLGIIFNFILTVRNLIKNVRGVAE